MKDPLGDRMKRHESQTMYRVPKRSYFIIRLDGCNMSKWTKKLDKPFDEGFAEDMQATAAHLCANLQGAVFAYYQSDEISILFTDFETNEKQQLYDGKIQKITSISASMATANFNKLRLKRRISNLVEVESFKLLDPLEPNDWLKEVDEFIPGMFDSRVIVITDPDEVINYFWWRQKDASKNSISMACYANFSHKQTNGKNSSEKQDMLMEKGINWNDYAVVFKRGVIIKKEQYMKGEAVRNRWASVDPPIFSQDWGWLADLVPFYRSTFFKL